MVGFGLPRLMAQLNIEYDNGETVSVVSDDSWKATNHGPITANNEFDGEHYDARLELGKWTESGYDDSGWQLAERMEAPKGKLVAQLSPSLKVMEEIKPISVKSVGDGRYIVDMGQNMVGIQQVKLRGKKDKPITMRFAEVLKDNGTELYLDNLRSALSRIFILLPLTVSLFGNRCLFTMVSVLWKYPVWTMNRQRMISPVRWCMMKWQRTVRSRLPRS